LKEELLFLKKAKDEIRFVGLSLGAFCVRD